MKCAIAACLIGSILTGGAVAQDSKVPLKKGVAVQMAVASHAVEMRAADDPNTTVVAITAEGKVYAGIQPTEVDALGKLSAETVYLKADSRVPYQKVVAVLDALRGKSVVLLTASPANAGSHGITPPYGMKLSVAR